MSCLRAWLLFRGYRARHTKLLFWSSLCFVALALNNALLLVDLYAVPQADLFLLRTVPALLGVSALLYGLIWDSH